MQWYNLQGPLTARAPRHVPYVPQWLIRPWMPLGTEVACFSMTAHSSKTPLGKRLIYNAQMTTRDVYAKRH